MQENINQQEDIKPVESNKAPETIDTEEGVEDAIEETKKEIFTDANDVIQEDQELFNEYSQNSEIQEVIQDTNEEILILTDNANAQIEYIQNENEGDINFEIQKNETRDEYLHRIGQYLRAKYTKENGHSLAMFRDEFEDWDLDETTLKMIWRKLNTIPEYSTLNQEKNNQILNKQKTDLEKYGEGTTRNVEDNNYDVTGRKRNFYTERRKHGSRYLDYSTAMFGVPRINIEEQKEYLQSIINDKNIILLGGGYSCQDLLDSSDFHPRSITNIDPFVDESKISQMTQGSKVNYKLVKQDASSPQLSDQLTEEGIEKADEIWALYSVPYYLKEHEQVTGLFKNIASLLKKNGKSRICPITTPCKAGLIDALQTLIDTNKFNISNDGRVIEKLED